MKALTLKRILSLTLASLLILTACTNKDKDAENSQAEPDKLTDVTLVLNWYPNTNHTGLYAARDLGYYEEAGLRVDIVPPGVNGSSAIVGAGEAAFGVSIQENVTEARIQGVPIVSIATLMQHNTSVFASPVDKNITSPKDFEGKVYGGFGSPAEAGILQSLMQADGGADADKVKSVNLGEADFFTAIERDVDFSWIFYGWTGIEAELRGVPLNIIHLTDYSDKLDYYTPLLITNEKTIQQQPELVKAFLAATAKGFQYAVDHPEEAAKILLQAAPELDEELVMASQKWISPRYQDDAPQWGIQKKSVWENYASWMREHGLIEEEFDAEAAFTNEFLPEAAQ
ncbi:ABC transporter substrate-binding protein [Paenibacillus sp. J2TS4]|uniref:ABC transporter substrate-binding protein n=1 Tax=Paenibacillus sp. J2TS4 TaxID=2807194 RepID=UPI001B047980|nr:ABC transporter substrate-binding protein [Paenibacillus sp. J2TS4]GIP34409.1 nitrate ABC transporter substrate-binding protein [Paenibacillus sp. J2TS4]